MLLVDRLGYKSASINLSSPASDLPALAKEFETWKGIDLVAAYHHPDLGLLIANPKIAGDLVNFGTLRKRELLVVYAGKGNDPADDDCLKAAKLAINAFNGRKAKAPPAFLKGKFTVKKAKAPAPELKKEPKKETKSARAATPVLSTSSPAISGGPTRMTPMYSVMVTNELFHNGNVEAWKRIIESYNAKYPELKVFLYYEGERILDINTLFKWGKVKHGSSVQFAVAGNEIKDVAKLQRYLIQGASSRFEDFLKGPVSTVLKLFV